MQASADLQVPAKSVTYSWKKNKCRSEVASCNVLLTKPFLIVRFHTEYKDLPSKRAKFYCNFICRYVEGRSRIQSRLFQRLPKAVKKLWARLKFQSF